MAKLIIDSTNIKHTEEVLKNHEVKISNIYAGRNGMFNVELEGSNEDIKAYVIAEYSESMTAENLAKFLKNFS